MAGRQERTYLGTSAALVLASAPRVLATAARAIATDPAEFLKNVGAAERDIGSAACCRGAGAVGYSEDVVAGDCRRRVVAHVSRYYENCRRCRGLWVSEFAYQCIVAR